MPVIEDRIFFSSIGLLYCENPSHGFCFNLTKSAETMVFTKLDMILSKLCLSYLDFDLAIVVIPG